jgi:rfaE bifunctional protein kinase chain/domain
MLSHASLEKILNQIPRLRLGVLGDLFLDRYLDIDAGLTEPSIETGLDAYQVVRVRSYPGAAGTVINNLVALGIRQVTVISIIGDDGEGYELLKALRALQKVDITHVMLSSERRTPTYIKPMLLNRGQAPRELNRLDIKNRTPLPAEAEVHVQKRLATIWPEIDALMVLDQVSEPGCGVVTAKLRDRLAELGEDNPSKMILADSRRHIGQFRSVWLKPNETECRQAVEATTPAGASVADCAALLARRTGRPLFCTLGERGIHVVDPRSDAGRAFLVPAYTVAGPIDIVGAGDSTSAAIACAVAAGGSLEEAAAFGNLVASITIQQIGSTGTASPAQVRQRWQAIQQQSG